MTPIVARAAARSLRRDVGDGWRWLVPEVRLALVDSVVLAIVRQQDRESITLASIEALHAAVHAAVRELP